MNEHPLIDLEGQKQIVQAIKDAENQTSGEIKVHIEEKCAETDVMDRAKIVFGQLGMHETELRNGVLFYLAYGDHKFAVLGDQGIYQRVPVNFWESTKELLRFHFAKGEFVVGLTKGIEEAGKQLKHFFPYQKGDSNELPDDISFG